MQLYKTYIAFGVFLFPVNVKRHRFKTPSKAFFALSGKHALDIFITSVGEGHLQTQMSDGFMIDVALLFLGFVHTE